MVVAVRAFVSIVMLAGFYVLAAFQVLFGVVFAIWLGVVTTGAIGSKLGTTVCVAAGWTVGYGTWKALRAAGAGPQGLPLTEQDAPGLWAMVRELSAVAGTRPPDELFLLPEVNAAVSERSRFMGLVPVRRYLYIGLPLLLRFNVAQLRSVLAHELGHYSGRHTRFAGISYRGRIALQRTISQTSSINVAGWTFRGYARLFLLVENAVSRRQELEADLAAVRVAGRAAASSALLDLEVIGPAFDEYLSRYVLPGAEAGFAPEDLFAGFAQLLQVRAEELSALRAGHRDDPGRSSRWDTHPPTGARIAAMSAAPEPATALDFSPARSLVPDVAAAGRALQAQLLPAAEFVALSWEDFRSATAGAQLQTQANAALRTVSAAADQPVPHAGAALDLIAAGDIDAPAAARLAEPLALLFALAALRSGAARWQHSWVAPTVLVGNDGTDLDLDLTATAALATDPATLPAARQRLTALGIDPTTAKPVRQAVNTVQAEITGGMTTLQVDGRRADLLILTNGLLLMPGMPKYKTGMARFRMNDWLANGDARTLSTTPGSRFIPYTEIRTATRTSKLFRWHLTLHDGTGLDVRTGLQSELHDNADHLFTTAMRTATT